MVQRSFYFLVVWLLMFNGEILGQENPRFGEKNLTGRNNIVRYAMKKFVRLSNPIAQNSHIAIPIFKKIQIVEMDCFTPRIIYRMAAVDFISSNELGWFCRKELQLDKITTIPFRFRLGSLNYVNWMEQKPNTVRF